MLKKILASALVVLISASAHAISFYDTSTTTLHPSEPLTTTESDIDYRHMGLYELKKNLYYNTAPHPETNPENTTTVIQHEHHHNHWGWGGGWWGIPYWGDSNHSSSSTSDDSKPFTEKVSGGIKKVATVAVVATVVAAAAYGTTQAAFTLWPYMGAASLTAIELPHDSPWRITSYKTASGTVITRRHFDNNQDALDAATEGEMFDKHHNGTGRFLLVDQENWWGLTDHPTDIDITLTRPHADGPDESVTINFLRAVTNGLKPGAVTAEIQKPAKSFSLRGLYNFSMRVKAPTYFEFHKWYHIPTRIIIDLQLSGGY